MSGSCEMMFNARGIAQGAVETRCGVIHDVARCRGLSGGLMLGVTRRNFLISKRLCSFSGRGSELEVPKCSCTMCCAVVHVSSPVVAIFSLIVKWKKIKWFFCSVEPSSPSRIASALSLDASLPCQFEQDEITGATLVQARAESVKKLSKKLERSVF